MAIKTVVMSDGGSGKKTPKITDKSNDYKKTDTDIALANEIAAQKEAKKMAYETMRKGLKEVNSYLGNANVNLLSVIECLGEFAGNAINKIKSNLQNEMEEINDTGKKAERISQKAAEKEIELGATPDSANDGRYINLEPNKGKLISGIYHCDPDLLLNKVIPLVDAADKNLEKAKEAASKLPKNAEGCEESKNLPTGIDDTKEKNNKIRKAIEDFIDKNRIAEEKNLDVLIDIFGQNSDIPYMANGMNIADIGNTGAAIVKGVGNVLESIIDGVIVLGTQVADTGSMATGEFVPYEEGKRGISEECWKGVMGFVAEDHVENVYTNFYKDTEAGKWLDEKANEPFKSTGVATEIVSGVGEVVGIAAVTALSGGTSAGAMAAVAGATGFGKYTEEHWENARDEAGGEDWATENVRYNGMLYGAANGAWEAAQWYLGGKVNNLAIDGVSKVGNSAIRVGIDTAVNAFDTPFRTLVDAATSDKTIHEAWEKQGGWTSVLTNVGVGLLGSIGGEVFENISPKKVGVILEEGNGADKAIKPNFDIYEQGDKYEFKITKDLDPTFKEIVEDIADSMSIDRQTGENLEKILRNDDYIIGVHCAGKANPDLILNNGLILTGHSSSGVFANEIDLELNINFEDKSRDILWFCRDIAASASYKTDRSRRKCNNYSNTERRY